MAKNKKPHNAKRDPYPQKETRIAYTPPEIKTKVREHFKAFSLSKDFHTKAQAYNDICAISQSRRAGFTFIGLADFEAKQLHTFYNDKMKKG